MVTFFAKNNDTSFNIRKKAYTDPTQSFYPINSVNGTYKTVRNSG